MDLSGWFSSWGCVVFVCNYILIHFLRNVIFRSQWFENKSIHWTYYVTSSYSRKQVEKNLNMNLADSKSWVNEQILTIYGQMDEPSLILDYLYLGTEWNACNLEELQENGKFNNSDLLLFSFTYLRGSIKSRKRLTFDGLQWTTPTSCLTTV